jgi:hypothetical protein
MKTKTIAVFILAIIALFIGAEANKSWGADLVWDDPNPPSAGVVSYKVHSLVGTNWNVIATTTTNRWSIVLAPGNYVLSVSALNQVSESPRSTNKLVSIVILVPPVNVRVEQ